MDRRMCERREFERMFVHVVLLPRLGRWHVVLVLCLYLCCCYLCCVCTFVVTCVVFTCVVFTCVVFTCVVCCYLFLCVVTLLCVVTCSCVPHSMLLTLFFSFSSFFSSFPINVCPSSMFALHCVSGARKTTVWATGLE